MRIQNILRNLRYIRKVRFTGREIAMLTISMLIITFCFSLSDLLYPSIPYQIAFGITLLTLGLGFILHEIGQKISAQTWGFGAEFRVIPQGLLLTIMSAVISMGTIVFAIPGAVRLDIPQERQMELQDTRMKKIVLMEIAYAGVLINMILAMLFGIIGIVFGLQGMNMGLSICIRGFAVNSWLAFFNLLPIKIGAALDGKQMYDIDRRKWAMFFMISIAMLAVYFLLMSKSFG